jgi:hypothetical protein
MVTTDPLFLDHYTPGTTSPGFSVGGVRPNVRFGSEADVTLMKCNVCFTPESGH